MDKRNFRSQLIAIWLQAMLYLSVFACFFLLLSITNAPIVKYSRTAAVTIATFGIVLFLLTNVYGGFRLGERKARPVFFAIVISVVLTDIFTYVILQIMNVNPANNQRLILFNEDFLLLCVSIAIQLGLIYLYVRLGNFLYFRINPPEHCCIIASSQEEADHVADKINTFARKYKICDVLHYHCDDLYQTIMEHDAVFLAGIPDTEEAAIETFCYKHGKSMYLTAELEDVIISSSAQIVLDDTLFLYSQRVEPTLLQRIIKRTMDILFSAIAIVLFSPVMLVSAIVIKCNDREGPVLFKQQRATINGRIFTIIKFRTMFEHDQTAHNYSSTKNDSRVTSAGHVLRRLRIDELPQLFNIFMGDMSFVGPRPEMLSNIDRYTRDVPEFEYRQKMKAGMTGLAQIDGKYNTSPKDKIILDLMYIHRFSLMLDIKLMLRTVTVLFRPDSSEGFQTRRRPGTMTMRIRAKARP